MEKKTINVLDGWHEVTIGQYQEIASLKMKNQTKKMIEIISILTNEDPVDIQKMELKTLTLLVSHLNWINKLPDDANYKPIINIDGIDYGFISRLTDLSLGEWIDLEHYLTDINMNMHKILSVLYRPLELAINDSDRIIEEYNGDTVENRSILFKEKVLIGDVYGAFVFFSIIVNESMKTIQDCLMEDLIQTQMKNLEMKQLKIKNNVWNRIWKIIKNLKNGCGILMRTSYVGVMLQKWKLYLKPISI